jgi:hypothetical protein
MEEAFLKIKHFLCHHQEYYLSENEDRILFDMYEVMEIITMGYYMHAGYF